MFRLDRQRLDDCGPRRRGLALLVAQIPFGAGQFIPDVGAVAIFGGKRLQAVTHLCQPFAIACAPPLELPLHQRILGMR